MKLLWKIYYFIVLFQAIYIPLSLFVLETSISADELFNWIFAVKLFNWIFIVIGAIGLYSYVFQKHIGQSSFWHYFLYLIVVWDIFYLLIWQSFLTGVQYLLITWFFALVLLCFLIPQYMALYRLSKNQTSKALPSEHRAFKTP